MQTTKSPTPHLDAIREALGRNDNILISGGPNSGKTTFLDTLLNEATRMHNPARRTIVLQADAQELHIPENANILSLRANVEQESPERGRYTLGFYEILDDLIKFGAPIDSLVFGDILNEDAARAFMLAATVGIRGFLGNIHAHAGIRTLHRLDMLLGSYGKEQRYVISQFVQLIVHFGTRDTGEPRRFIDDVSRVIGVDASGEYVLESVA